MLSTVQNTWHACSSFILTAAQAAVFPICRGRTRLGEVEELLKWKKLLCETHIYLTPKTVLSWLLCLVLFFINALSLSFPNCNAA